MAQNRWAPKNIFRKLKIRVSVSGSFAGETFEISVGGLPFATFTDSGHTAAQIATGLVTYWNSTSGAYYQHPYKTMTITDNGDGTIDFEAVTAGVPFTLTLNTPGGSAVFGQSVLFSNLSPNDVSITSNWSLGALPTTAGDIKIPAGTPDMLWGLDQITDTADDWHFEAGCGKIGLPAETFQVTPTQVNTTVPEYRPTHLVCKGTDHYIGQATNLSNPVNWPERLKIDTSNVASNIQNQSTARQTGAHPPVQIKSNHSSTVIHNYGADVGVGEDVWADTTTIAKAYNYMPFSRMRIGFNVTYTHAEFHSGARGFLGSYPSTELLLSQGSDVEPQIAGTIAKVRGPGTLSKKVVTVAITAAE